MSCAVFHKRQIRKCPKICIKTKQAWTFMLLFKLLQFQNTTQPPHVVTNTIAILRQAAEAMDTTLVEGIQLLCTFAFAISIPFTIGSTSLHIALRLPRAYTSWVA
eukprot:6143488-Amphidinium_carterae.1